MSIRSTYCFLVGIFYLASAFQMGDKEGNLSYSGIASSLTSAQVYYSEEFEEHHSQGILQKTHILYKNPKGQVIVKKTIDFSKNLICPSFQQEDVRTGNLESAEVVPQGILLSYRKNHEDKLRSKCLHIPGTAVIDGGFNYYVKQNWSRLMQDETLKFNFAVPSQLDYFSFKIGQKQELDFQGRKAVRWIMEPDHFLIRALVKPIVLYYDLSTKRLLQYEGMSNINDESGKSYLVKLTYAKFGP